MMLTDSLCGSSRGKRSVHTLRAFAVIGLLFWATPDLSAATVTATWNGNSESNIGGYILSYGTQSGIYSTILDVGNVTTKQLTLNAGQRYYFVIQAYNTSSAVSLKSAELFYDVPATTAPSITSLSPTSGSAGTTVTITGANFGATQGTSTVRFNGIGAAITSWSATSIKAAVPSTATTGPVTVTVGSVVSAGVTFTVGSVSSAITLTQHAGVAAGANGTTATLAFPANNVAGNFIAVVARAYTANQTFTVTDTRGNLYRRALTVNNNTNDTLGIYYAENIIAGANTVTVKTAVATAAPIRMAILEYAGVARSSALDVTATATQSSASPSSASATTTAAGDLLIGAVSTQSYRTVTAGSSYTLRESVAAAPSTVLTVEDRVQATAGAVSATATLSTSDMWGAGLAAFKKASTGTNLAPTLTQPANQTSLENTTISLPLVASDPNGNTLTYSATGLPPSLTVNPTTGVIAGTLTFTSAGTYTVTATVSDGSLTNGKTFTWTVSNVNRAPTLTQPANQSSIENTIIALPLVASDPDGTALTFSATGLPASLSVSSTTGVIAGTLTSTSAGTYTVTATVSDGSLTNSKTFTWTITDVTLPTPIITSLSPTSGSVGTQVTINGTNFGTTGTVRFNGISATVTSWTATSIMATVPSGATTGPVTVTVGSLVSTGVTFTVPASSGITLVQNKSRDGGTATSSSLAFNANNVAGHFIAVVIRAGGSGAGLTVTDTRANTYRQAARFASGTDHVGAIYYAENIGGGANTITVSVSSASTLRFAILEYAGVAASSALDRAVTAVGTGTSASSGTLTTTVNGDLLLGAITINDNVNVVPGAGYTIRESVPVLPATKAIAEDRIQASAATASATGTLSVASSWGAGLAAFKPAASGTSSATLTSMTATGSSLVSAVSASLVVPRTDDDYDGDGKADVTVFTPSTATWSILASGTGTALTTVLGAAGDKPVPGDYDGDGQTDIAVYHPATGEWSVLLSSTGALTAATWGSGTDVPVPADYDGDGKTDLAVYRPTTGAWIVLRSTTNTARTVVWGSSADVPAPGDYDGDGKADLAVYRQTNGLWQILQSSTNTTATATLGSTGALAMPGDYDGDGTTDVAVYQPSSGVWSILQSSTSATRTVTWGSSSDVPVPGDYDGDGTTDLTVFRPSTGLWQILQSSTNTTKAVTWGMSTDIPVR